MNKIVFRGRNGRAYIGKSTTFTEDDRLAGLIDISDIGPEASDVDTTDMDDVAETAENGIDSYGTCDINLNFREEVYEKLKNYRKTGEEVILGTFVANPTTGEVVYKAGYRAVVKKVSAGAIAMNERFTYSVTVRINGEVDGEITEPAVIPEE